MRVALLLLLAGCASAHDPGVAASQEELCSAAPIRNADGTSTLVGCSYEMHVYNITHHGQPAAGAVIDASGRRVAVASHACGRYLYGQDESGVSVIVDRQDGSVTSHGAIHSGYGRSDLTRVALPLSIAR